MFSSKNYFYHFILSKNYHFILKFLSNCFASYTKKEYENKEVLVGYNGTDGKEVTMSKLKEDINEIRYSRSTFKN